MGEPILSRDFHSFFPISSEFLLERMNFFAETLTPFEYQKANLPFLKSNNGNAKKFGSLMEFHFFCEKFPNNFFPNGNHLGAKRCRHHQEKKNLFFLMFVAENEKEITAIGKRKSKNLPDSPCNFSADKFSIASKFES